MSMPDFDDAVQPQPPKKKRKPMKKRRKMRKDPGRPKALILEHNDNPIAPKKRRKYKKRANGHVRTKRGITIAISPKQYNAISSLLEMTRKDRAAVLDIVKGLAK